MASQTDHGDTVKINEAYDANVKNLIHFIKKDLQWFENFIPESWG